MPYGYFQRLLSGVLFGGVVLCSASATAEQNRRFDLTWAAPTGCPNPGEVAREIDELVAGSSLTPAKSMIDAQASVSSDQGGFALVLTLRDAEGSHQRRLEAPSCDELGHAAALIVALAIDPALLATHPDPSAGALNTTQMQAAITSSATSSPSSTAAPIAGSAQSQVPAVSRPTPIALVTVPLLWRLGLFEFVGFGTLPGINLGAGMFGAIQTKSFRFEGAVSALRAEAQASKPSAGATFALYRFAPKACWVVTEKQWAIGPCVGAELGIIPGRGYGVDDRKESNGRWFASTFGALFEARLTSSSLLGVTADAEVPWRHDQFTLNESLLFEPKVSARLGISLAAGWR